MLAQVSYAFDLRRHRAHLDQRVGEGGGEAVGVVVDIHQHHLHPPHARAVPRLVGQQDLVGQGGRLAGQGLDPLVVMDGHPAGGDATEAQARRERGRRGGPRRDRQQRQQQEEGTAHTHEGGG